MTAVSVLFAGIWSLHYVSLIRGLKTSRISKTGWGKPVGDCPRPGLPKSPPKAFQSGRNWGYVTQVGCLLLQGCSCGKSIQGSYAFYFFFLSLYRFPFPFHLCLRLFLRQSVYKSASLAAVHTSHKQSVGDGFSSRFPMASALFHKMLVIFGKLIAYVPRVLCENNGRLLCLVVWGSSKCILLLTFFSFESICLELREKCESVQTSSSKGMEMAMSDQHHFSHLLSRIFETMCFSCSASSNMWCFTLVILETRGRKGNAFTASCLSFFNVSSIGDRKQCKNQSFQKEGTVHICFIWPVC